VPLALGGIVDSRVPQVNGSLRPQIRMEIQLQLGQRRFFRDQLREARSIALLDGEGFQAIVSALERLGFRFRPPKSSGELVCCSL
jgi:hypothetical protein